VTPGHETCQHGAYRLSCEEFEALLQRSSGTCEICGTPRRDVPGGKLYIDHDGRYDYRAVRGMLCPKCNSLMRYVDNGRKPDTPEVRRYLRNAWFVSLLKYRSAIAPASE
jgi:hypothetical protein